MNERTLLSNVMNTHTLTTNHVRLYLDQQPLHLMGGEDSIILIRDHSLGWRFLHQLLKLIYVMDHEVGPWKMAFFHGPTSIVQFLKKIKVTKPLGPSLGVNQMWTKRNGHAPKSECAIFLIICPKRVSKFDNFQVWPFSCLLLSSSSLPPKKKSFKFYYNNISLPWTLAFSYQSTYFVSPTTKPVGPW